MALPGKRKKRPVDVVREDKQVVGATEQNAEDRKKRSTVVTPNGNTQKNNTMYYVHYIQVYDVKFN